MFKNKEDNKVHTLHRYFIWADRMRVHYDQLLKHDLESRRKPDPNFPFTIEQFMYMSLWYSETYVVIEGWKQLRLKDEQIDALLKSSNVDLLRRYRNGVFHYQSSYFDNRLTGLIVDGNKAGVWIRELREELSRFFLDWYKEKGITPDTNKKSLSS